MDVENNTLYISGQFPGFSYTIVFVNWLGIEHLWASFNIIDMDLDILLSGI